MLKINTILLINLYEFEAYLLIIILVLNQLALVQRTKTAIDIICKTNCFVNKNDVLLKGVHFYTSGTAFNL